MLKHILVLVLLSIALIFTISQTHLGLTWLLDLHAWISSHLTQIFSGSVAGDVTRKLIALIAAPLAIALIPAMIFWVVKRKWFPYFLQVLWITWIVQSVALVALFKLA